MKYRIAFILNDPTTNYEDEKWYVEDADLILGDGTKSVGLTYAWDVERAAIFTDKHVFNRLSKRYNRNEFCEWDGERDNTWWRTTIVMEEVA